MSEQSPFQPAALGWSAGREMEALGATRETSRTARPVTLAAADKAAILVRRAMHCIESDRQVALRCLNDVATLLGAGAHDLAACAPALPSAFQPGGLARWQARRVLGHIEQYLGSKLDTRELAALVSFSKSHFSRAFKRSFSISPMAYVCMRRVERAKVMMTSTREQLSEIALACGFADQPHLNRSFRRMLGMSPGTWRRTNARAQDADAG
jgi:AraC family transcriptional regulator